MHNSRLLKLFLYQACARLSVEQLKSIFTENIYGSLDTLYNWYRDELFRQHKDKDDDHIFDCDDVLKFIQDELFRLGYILRESAYGDELVPREELED